MKKIRYLIYWITISILQTNPRMHMPAIMLVAALALAHTAVAMPEHTAADDAHFPGSRIIGNNASWGPAVNTWAKKPAAQTWSLCFSSITDNHDTPATFHRQCDSHNTTVVFVRNSIGNVFGGYVRGYSFPFSARLPLFSVDATRAPEMPGHLITWLRLL